VDDRSFDPRVAASTEAGIGVLNKLMSVDFVGDGPERHSSEPSHELTHGQRWPFRGNSWLTSPPRPDPDRDQVDQQRRRPGARPPMPCGLTQAFDPQLRLLL
jgi:hypothetical protein